VDKTNKKTTKKAKKLTKKTTTPNTLNSTFPGTERKSPKNAAVSGKNGGTILQKRNFVEKWGEGSRKRGGGKAARKGVRGVSVCTSLKT